MKWNPFKWRRSRRRAMEETVTPPVVEKEWDPRPPIREVHGGGSVAIEPMSYSRRYNNYLRQTGRREVTARQGRRLRKKGKRALRRM